jgi:hypothetical protein
MSQKKSVGRRAFFVGLLGGAGAAVAVAAAPKAATAKKKTTATAKGSENEPVLYRRTKDVERYYRTLYS